MSTITVTGVGVRDGVSVIGGVGVSLDGKVGVDKLTGVLVLISTVGIKVGVANGTFGDAGVADRLLYPK